MTRLALCAAGLAALSFPAWAHEGHGANDAHWHATDAWGFVVTLALMGAAIWFGRRK